ncbi:MAG: hypothetical protein IJI25_08685 [Eubacterium sp.]|nr:hypothetical protein [Eubacterium sp.]
MKLCNDTITVFNARIDDDKGYDTYEPTIIRGVSWFCEIASNVDSSGLKAANKFTIRIPEDADFSGKAYVTPAAYAGGDPKTAFTLQQGDIIVHGEETGFLRPAQLKEKYGETVTILGVTDNRRSPNAKHWKVVGA